MMKRFVLLSLLGLLTSSALGAVSWEPPVDYSEVETGWPDCASSACTSSTAPCKTISSDSDWAEVENSSSSYTQFCVVPGNYVSRGDINPGYSGSSGTKRYITYYNSALGGSGYETAIDQERNGHSPAYIKRFDLDNKDYWKTRGLTVSDLSHSVNDVLLEITNDSDYNLIDGWLFEGGNQSQIRVRAGSDHNTVQNTVTRKSDKRYEDTHGTYITPGDGRGAPYNDVKYFTYWHNECYDVNGDCIQINNSDPDGNGEVPGLMIGDSDLYVDTYHTDGAGNYSATGKFACGENAIDFKAAVRSDYGADNPRVYYNRMWGFRREDQVVDGSGYCSNTLHKAPGAAINMQSDKAIGDTADYIQSEGNLIFDSAQGYYIESGRKHISLYRDIFDDVSSDNNSFFYDTTIGAITYSNNQQGALRMTGTTASEIVIKDSGVYFGASSSADPVDFASGWILDSTKWYSSSTFNSGSNFDDLHYYNVGTLYLPPANGATTNYTNTAASSTGKGDLQWTIKQLTNPTTKIITGIDFFSAVSPGGDPTAPSITIHKRN